MTDIPTGGWTIYKDDDGEYRIPTLLLRKRDSNVLETAIDRLLDTVTQRDHYAKDGLAIKQKYDCCGCAAYMKIVRDGIAAMRASLPVSLAEAAS